MSGLLGSGTICSLLGRTRGEAYSQVLGGSNSLFHRLVGSMEMWLLNPLGHFRSTPSYLHPDLSTSAFNLSHSCSGLNHCMDHMWRHFLCPLRSPGACGQEGPPTYPNFSCYSTLKSNLLAEVSVLRGPGTHTYQLCKARHCPQTYYLSNFSLPRLDFPTMCEINSVSFVCRVFVCLWPW